jgi:hypothetical protein
MVTPWFAAGAGVLIATAILLESPGRAVLSYGPPLEPGVNCRYQGCTAASGGHSGRGSLTTTQQGTRLHHAPARPAAHGQAGRHPHVSAAAVTVSFREHRHGNDGFVGVITLTSSRRALGDWQLSFRVPGVRIMAVQGAAWQPNTAGDGGLASWTGSGPAGSWPSGSGQGWLPGQGGGAGSSGQGGDGQGGSGAADSGLGGPDVAGQARGLTAQIVFFAVGDPQSGALADCTFNGAGCSFG